MRLIPKNTKVKMQFYKGISFIDIVIGLAALCVVMLAVTSNLPYKFVIALGIVCVFLPMFISFGEEKIYMSLLYMVKYLFSKKSFAGIEAGELIPFERVEENLILNKDGGFTGVIELKPIEFRLLSESKQSYIIDGVITNVLNSIGSGREACIVKLEKDFSFDKALSVELERINGLIRSRENGLLTEEEYRARMDILEDRMLLLDDLNSNGAIKYSAYYLALFDTDEKSLLGSLGHIKKLLSAGGIGAVVLSGEALAEFAELSLGLSVAAGEPDSGDTETEELKSDNDFTPRGVTPQAVSFGAMSTRQGDKALSHFFISDYPLKVGNAWGEELFDIPDTRVVMKLKAVEKFKAVKRIDNAIMELAAQGNGKASRIIDRSTHIETLSSLLTGLQNENETLFDTTLILTAYDKKGESAVKKSVRRELRELGLTFNEMFGRQQEAYLSGGVSTYNSVNISRGIQASSIAACFPFVSDAVTEDCGILLGENKLPVLIDFFKRGDDHVNSNIVIIGKSGSGKSYAVKALLAHLSTLDARIFVLDPESEYLRLANALRGKVLDVSSGKYGRLNPFQIIASLDDGNADGTKNSFFAHLQFLEEFFKLILQGINADCLELVNKCALELYLNKGITADTDISFLHPADYPVFDDLAEFIDGKLKTERDEYAKSCLKILANYVSKFRSGGRNSALWNGPSSFDTAENFVCFDFQKLLANKNNTVANAQMLLVLKMLENEIIKNRDYNLKNGTDRKVIVVIDEAHVFIDEKYPIALDFMYQLGKRIRKYNGMQIVITQNVKDFAGTPETARKSMAIVNVSQYSLIFSLSPNDMSDLCALYEKAGQINEAEQESIVYNPRGRAFLISSPASRTNIRIVATPYMEGLFNNEIIKE